MFLKIPLKAQYKLARDVRDPLFLDKFIKNYFSRDNLFNLVSEENDRLKQKHDKLAHEWQHIDESLNRRASIRKSLKGNQKRKMAKEIKKREGILRNLDKNVTFYDQNLFCSNLRETLDHFTEAELTLQAYRLDILAGRAEWEKRRLKYVRQIIENLNWINDPKIARKNFELREELILLQAEMRKKQMKNFVQNWADDCNDFYLKLLASESHTYSHVNKEKIKAGEICRSMYLSLAPSVIEQKKREKADYKELMASAQLSRIRETSRMIMWNTKVEDDNTKAFNKWFLEIEDQQQCYANPINKVSAQYLSCRRKTLTKFSGIFRNKGLAELYYLRKCHGLVKYNVPESSVNNQVSYILRNAAAHDYEQILKNKKGFVKLSHLCKKK